MSTSSIGKVDGHGADGVHALRPSYMRRSLSSGRYQENRRRRRPILAQATVYRLLELRACVSLRHSEDESELEQMMKCDMCYDRTSAGKRPMCATVCPSQALAYVPLEEIRQTRREKPVNVFSSERKRSRRSLHDDAGRSRRDSCRYLGLHVGAGAMKELTRSIAPYGVTNSRSTRPRTFT